MERLSHTSQLLLKLVLRAGNLCVSLESLKMVKN